MKRFLSAGIMVPLFFVLALTALNVAAADDCTINFYLGEVQVRLAGAGDWQVAEMGDALQAGDVIRTMIESRVELEMSDGTTVELGENALFEVKKINDAQQQRSFKILSGKVVANVKKLTKSRSEFQIESPVAIAAVRGTKFSMHVQQGGKTAIAVQEGNIEVKLLTSKQRVAVRANQVISVTKEAFEIKTIKTKGTKDEVPPKLNMESPKGGSVIKKAEIEIKGSTEPTATVTIDGEATTLDKAGVFSAKKTLKEEGTHSITITATDTASNVMEMILDVMLNTSAPEVVLTSTVGDTTNAEVTTIIGTVTDKTPDDIVSVTFNGEAIEVLEGKFSQTIRLQEGDNIFTATATDLAGNVGKAEQKVQRIISKKKVVDTDAPVITIDAPATGTETEDVSVTVKGAVSDNYPLGELTASIKVGSKSEVLVLTEGAFQHAVLLQEGENTITVTATDKAGNAVNAAVQVKVTKDKSAPRVTISSSVGSKSINKNCIISGNVSDNVELSKLKASIKVGDKTEDLDVSSGMYRYPATLKSGQNTFVVTVTDIVGNVGTATITVLLNDDKDPPRVTIRSSVGEKTTLPNINISGTVTDNARLSEMKATIIIGGKTEVLEVTSGVYSHMLMLEDGENNVVVVVKDKAGNVGTATLVVLKESDDTNPPILVVQTGELNEFTNMQTVRISGNVQDIESSGNPAKMAQLRVTVGDEVVVLNNGTFTHTVYLEDGKNDIVVRAIDAAGNETVENVFKFYDRLAPIIVITRPAAGVSLPNLPGTPDNVNIEKTYLVTGFIQDPDPSSGIELVKVNGEPVPLTSDGSFEYEISGIRSGESFELLLEIEVIDRAQNRTIDISRTLKF